MERFGKYCLCSNNEPSSSTHRPDSDCDQKCSGNQRQTCGGYHRYNVYRSKTDIWMLSAV